jgi:choline dehydrogenase
VGTFTCVTPDTKSFQVTYINSRGRRVSAESAYLTPKVLSRPNLKVAIRAHVVRILFDKAGEVTRAVGVEFANTQDGPRFQARARKEVILSCVTPF